MTVYVMAQLEFEDRAADDRCQAVFPAVSGPPWTTLRGSRCSADRDVRAGR